MTYKDTEQQAGWDCFYVNIKGQGEEESPRKNVSKVGFVSELSSQIFLTTSSELFPRLARNLSSSELPGKNEGHHLQSHCMIQTIFFSRKMILNALRLQMEVATYET